MEFEEWEANEKEKRRKGIGKKFESYGFKENQIYILVGSDLLIA